MLCLDLDYDFLLIKKPKWTEKKYDFRGQLQKMCHVSVRRLSIHKIYKMFSIEFAE
jgi:hypothetical protein